MRAKPGVTEGFHYLQGLYVAMLQVHPCRAEAEAGVGEEGFKIPAAWATGMASPLGLTQV